MRVEQLTFTRFIAALSIVIYHYGSDSFLFNNQYVSFLFKQANIGVSYFFILSGFVMTIAYSNKSNFSVKKYWINRIARIYPLYLLALLIIIPFSISNNFNLIDLILNLSMTQTWFPNKALTMNFPGWSLSVETFFYLCFPLFLFYLRTKSVKSISLFIFSFWITSQVIYLLLVNNYITIPFYTIKDLYYHPILHLNEFLGGILTGVYFLNYKTSIKSSYNSLIILFMISLTTFILSFSINANIHNGLMTILFAPIIFLIATNRSILSKLFSKPIFIFLGNISFGLYILQAPVWNILSHKSLQSFYHTFSNTDTTFSFLIKFSILMLLSSISYKYIEDPVRNFIKKKISHK